MIQFSDAFWRSSAETVFPASYVEQKSVGLFSSFKKFRITCRTESVDSTVEIPRRVPSRDARVLFPVPEVPAKSTITLIFDCMSRDATKKSFKQSGF